MALLNKRGDANSTRKKKEASGVSKAALDSLFAPAHTESLMVGCFFPRRHEGPIRIPPSEASFAWPWRDAETSAADCRTI